MRILEKIMAGILKKKSLRIRIDLPPMFDNQFRHKTSVAHAPYYVNILVFQ